MPTTERKSYYDEASASHGRAIQSLLGRQLRSMYDSVVQEGVPDHLAALLDMLERKDPAKR